MSDCVIVVLRDDGVWDAACWDERCGYFSHSLRDDDGNWVDNGFPSEAAARRAAVADRKELAAEATAEKRCDHCGQLLRTEINEPKEGR